MVEYALLAAVLVVPTLGALQLLQDTAEAKTEQTAEGMSDPTVPSVPPPSSSPPASTTTTAPPPPPTTTTTTTTAPPTTTTTAPPPTTAAPTTARGTWASTDTRSRDRGNQWSASSTITVRDDRGQPVSGARVRIRIEYRWGDGSWSNGGEVTADTAASGALVVESGWFRTGGRPQDSPPRASEIRYRVTSASAPGLAWDGSGSTVVITP